MSESERKFHDIASQIPDAKLGKVFGAQCIKSGRKAAAILWNSDVLFKLDTNDQKEALSLNGSNVSSHLYAEDKPMNGWVTIPFNHAEKWQYFAEKAVKYVKSLIN